MISVKGKLTISTKFRVVESYGRQAKVAEDNYITTDETGTIRLSLWEQWIGELGGYHEKFVKLYNVVSKEYSGSKFLTTSAETFKKDIEEAELGKINVVIPVREK